MRVLMLGWELPPHNSGGLGVACYQLCRQLASDGVDIEFILPYSAKQHAEVDFMRIQAAHPQDVREVLLAGIAYDSFRYTNVYEDGDEEVLDMFAQQHRYEANIERVVALCEFDIIHAHDWLTFRAAMRAKQISGKPLVVHIHATEHDRSGGGHGNPMVREIEYLAMQMADQVVAVSNITKEILVNQYQVPSDKVRVIHNRMELDAPNSGDENTFRYLELMKSQGYRVVISIGRLTLQKNLVNLLYAAREVVQINPKALFLIVGSGEQYLELVELAAELGIGNNVIFTGFLRGRRWRDAYRIGDLFVMPSVSEPFGLTPLEAIGYGTPALVSHQSGVSELVGNMLKVDFWDVKEMANQIAAVLANDALRDELHSASYREFERLSWADASHALVDIYNSHCQEVAI